MAEVPPVLETVPKIALRADASTRPMHAAMGLVDPCNC
jgi:hypothetical protein